MKIASLNATKVHGHLPIDVSFNDDLTFLIGLNGSGKTTALRLLMALLTPNLHELNAIEFATAQIVVVENDEDVVVRVEKLIDGIQLTVSKVSGSLQISRSELELMQSKRGEEPRIQIRDLYRSNEIINEISKISTPMFLGIDRRFFVPSAAGNDIEEARRREFMARRFWPEDPAFRGPAAVESLIEVNYLVVSKVQEIRAAQETLDDRLRNEFFKKAFEYKPADFAKENPVKLPSRSDLDRYRKQLKKIEMAVEGVKIPMPEIQLALNHFFERMKLVVGAFDKDISEMSVPKTKRDERRPINQKPKASISEHHLEWIINGPQVGRILEHLHLLNEYIEKRDELRAPIVRFQSLVNEFLKQTRKKLEVATSGQLSVQLGLETEGHPISSLSSGERQLLVMLAHLSLNPSLAGSGVFIVDEPELSLHIDWQERFVEAIQEANPNVQMILATHSPAIILDRDENCMSMGQGEYA